MKMHDSDDIDSPRLDAIQETIGKLGYQNTPEAPAERSARGRKLEQAFIRVLNRKDEVEPRGRLLGARRTGLPI